MIPAFISNIINRFAKYRRQRILTKLVNSRPNLPREIGVHSPDVVFARSSRFTVDIDGISPSVFETVSPPSIIDGKWNKELYVSGWCIAKSEVPNITIDKLMHWACSSAGCKARHGEINLYAGDGSVIATFDLGMVRPKEIQFDTMNYEGSEPLRFHMNMECTKCVLRFPHLDSAQEDVSEAEGCCADSCATEQD